MIIKIDSRKNVVDTLICLFSGSQSIVYLQEILVLTGEVVKVVPAIRDQSSSWYILRWSICPTNNLRPAINRRAHHHKVIPITWDHIVTVCYYKSGELFVNRRIRDLI